MFIVLTNSTTIVFTQNNEHHGPDGVLEKMYKGGMTADESGIFFASNPQVN